MTKRQVYLLITIILLINGLLGCNVSRLAPFAAGTPTSQQLLPTPTLGPRATLSPFEPSNVLEEQIVAVYEQTAAAVVNITNRSYTYNYFMQAVPQEGTGSGFIYDATGYATLAERPQ